MGAKGIAIFAARLTLAVLTLFIVISYISKPTENRCQMTFMMEPPKFIPIPIDQSKSPVDHKHREDGGLDDRKQYTLFMYSEYGFPLESDIRRDLRDSMPVLFVPGNAGSYQQVRSLASTCIRRQLQSLDAFKFIFYTIDFKAQLSGISGYLVNQQISFVNSALRQISKMHSADTNGVIVIGHSVGGFIAKALFTRNDFDHNLVPLLINLASPLTRSFVNFDDEMRQIFVDTHNYWSRQSNQNETLAISISGGKSDRLVPMHLSLDPQYDLSLTTNSIKDVWLTTDHVSITWCRELVSKLSQLLSALMDRKHTRLIEAKNQALDIVEGQLLTKGMKFSDLRKSQFTKSRRLISTRNSRSFYNHMSIKRHELLESNVLLNLTGSTSGALFIWIEHIDDLKESGLYACGRVEEVDEQMFCEERVDLLGLSQTVPSRRYEPNRRVVMLKDAPRQFKYIGVEFASRSRHDMRKSQTPESVSMQVISAPDIQSLHIPTLLEYYYGRLLSPGSLRHKILVPNKLPITYSKMQVENLQYLHQFYSLIIETGSCETDDKSSETIVSVIQGEELSESFHPDKATQAVIVKLNSRRTISTSRRAGTESQEMFLDLFLNGMCEKYIRLEFDWWSFIEATIQRRSGEILTCSSYIAYASVVAQLLCYIGEKDLNDRKSTGHGLSLIYWMAGFMVAYGSSALDLGTISYATDHIITFISILMLSMGFVQMIEFFLIRRIIDLGIIVHKFITLIRELVGSHGRAVAPNGTNGTFNQEDRQQVYTRRMRKAFGIDVEWLIIHLTVISSAVFSTALMKICMLFIITIFQLRLIPVRDKRAISGQNEHLHDTGEHSNDQNEQDQNNPLQSLFVSLAALCILSLIGNIPAFLLETTPLDLNVNGNIFELKYFTSAASLALLKIICDQLESQKFEKNSIETNRYPLLRPLTYMPRQAHVLALAPISIIARNIRNMDYVECAVLIWAASVLFRVNTSAIVKNRKQA